jgi:replication factor C large subunit
MQFLSRADIYLGRVRKNQDYGLWNYSRKLMAALSLARKNPHTASERYRFPSYLRTMSRTKESRSSLKEASLKLGRVLHTSSRTVMEDPIWRLAQLCERDHELASSLVAMADLEEDHLKVLMGGRLRATDIEAIMEGAVVLASANVRPRKMEFGPFTDDDDEEDAVEPEPPVPVRAQDDAKGQEKGRRQSGLFDFR